MKTTILIILSICFCSILFSQDTILLRNGNEIRAKVLEEGVYQVKYNNFNDPDGLIFYLSKTDIFMIKYQNGTKTVINKKSSGEQMYQEPVKKISIGMDSIKFFIGYDILKGIVDENSLTVGYKLKKHHFITASIGFTYCNKLFQGPGLSSDYENYPLFAYKGPTFRASYYYLETSSFYYGLDVFYKHLYYTSHNFREEYNDAGNSTYFERSEDAKVYGWHIDFGWIVNYPKSRFYLNPSLGLGMTTKFRTYTTTNLYPPYWVSQWLPIGTFSERQSYVSFIMGLNIGVKF